MVEAHAEQGDYDGAIASLQRALELKSDVAEANSALGMIYFKQGKLAEASKALQAELTSHPEDIKARFLLATVLDLDGHSSEAVSELGRSQSASRVRRCAIPARKDPARERVAASAVEQLEIAVRLAPDDANIHFQLAQAYQKTGHAELAQQQFELYQKLKDKRRGGTDR